MASGFPWLASSSIILFRMAAFSSLSACSCRFHSSTFEVLSCSAHVSRALLFFSVCNSTSHFLAFAELCARASLSLSFS
uniref:Putative secreted protein n=1 Tax=Ixodes ricinus TaxID=34613 RepID=A0A6B0UCL1_IXORI